MSSDSKTYRRNEVNRPTTVQPRGNVYDRIAEAREQRAKSRPVSEPIPMRSRANRVTSRANPSVPLMSEAETTALHSQDQQQPANDNKRRTVGGKFTIAIGRLFGLYPKVPR